MRKNSYKLKIANYSKNLVRSCAYVSCFLLSVVIKLSVNTITPYNVADITTCELYVPFPY